MMKHVNIEIYTDINNDKLKNNYLDFESRTENLNITTSYYWIKKWWDVFSDYNNNKFGFDKKLRIVVLSNKNKIISIAPLVILKRKIIGFNIKFLEFLSQQWSAIYCDLIANNIKCDYLKLIIGKILSNERIDIIHLNHIPYKSKFFKKNELLPYAACPEVDLELYKNMDEYRKKRYSKNLKQNIRTAYNRASKIDVILSSKMEHSNEKSNFEIIRIAKSKLRDGKDFKYSDNRKKKFRVEIMNSFNSSHCFVYANENPVAYRTNVIYKGLKFCLDASYDRDYPRFDLGSLSVDANIQDSFNKCLKRHCMGPGLDFYKLKFATHIIILNYYISRGNTLLSRLFYYLLKRKLKKKSEIFLEDLNKLTNSKNYKVEI